MNIKKGLMTVISFVILLPIVHPVYAAPLRQNIQREGSSQAQINKEIREKVKEQSQGLLENIKNKIKLFKFGARITGTISAIGQSDITVHSKDGNIQVFILSTTQLRRRFWGKAELNEFSVGDDVNVIGKWKDNTKTQIEARMIRDVSIQKRYGVFFGDVTSKTDSSFVMKTVNRGDQTVKVSSSTQYTNRREQSMQYGDIVVGHRVRVKGLWDSKLNQIMEVTKVKDFSLPQQVKLSPTPTTQ